jgi:hypothetical protein
MNLCTPFKKAVIIQTKMKWIEMKGSHSEFKVLSWPLDLHLVYLSVYLVEDAVQSSSIVVSVICSY